VLLCLGLLQSSWQGTSAGPTSYCQGQILQQTGRRENKGYRWSLCARRLNTALRNSWCVCSSWMLGILYKNRIIKWKSYNVYSLQPEFEGFVVWALNSVLFDPHAKQFKFCKTGIIYLADGICVCVTPSARDRHTANWNVSISFQGLEILWIVRFNNATERGAEHQSICRSSDLALVHNATCWPLFTAP
jgi:hypothetical protein